MNPDNLTPVYILTIIILVSWMLFALSFLLPQRRAFRHFKRIRKQGRAHHAIDHLDDAGTVFCMCGKTFSSIDQAEGHIRRMSRYRTINRIPDE